MFVILKMDCIIFLQNYDTNINKIMILISNLSRQFYLDIYSIQNMQIALTRNNSSIQLFLFYSICIE